MTLDLLLIIYLNSIPVTTTVFVGRISEETGNDITVRDLLVAITVGVIPILNIILASAILVSCGNRIHGPGRVHKFLDKKLF